MEEIIILGDGGHARSLIDILERERKYKIAGCVVNDSADRSTDYPVIGTDEKLEALYQKGIKNAVIGIGYLGKSDVRKRLYVKLKKIGFYIPIVCDPSAIVSKKADIGEGTFIGKRAVINSGVIIGKMCIINTGAIVEHDCNIGEFTHIAVGGIVCGGTWVGKETLLGANSTVIQNVRIGENVIVGAGAMVNRDLKDSCTAAGVPARIIDRDR